jgi:hypothetical protein
MLILALISRPEPKYFLTLIFIVTFFVIATNKVTKEKSRQTRSLRAFCLASATHFVYQMNSL